MRSFVREKQIFCGSEYKEVDIFPYTGIQIQTAKGKRAKRIKESAPKQKNLNDKNARRYLTQLANLNFSESDLHITATYKNKYLPGTVEEAEKEISNYLRRVAYRREKEGLPPLKYILVTAYSAGKDGEKPTRIHHHVIMNGGISRDTLELMWTRKRINWKKLKNESSYQAEIRRNSTGYINADRLQPDENGIAALTNYLEKQGYGKKRWSSSQNLKKPTSSPNDTRYSRREVEKIAKEKLYDIAFWEKQYKGWTITNVDYGVDKQYNDKTGWSIYLKLRRKRC